MAEESLTSTARGTANRGQVLVSRVTLLLVCPTITLVLVLLPDMFLDSAVSYASEMSGCARVYVSNAMAISYRLFV